MTSTTANENGVGYACLGFNSMNSFWAFACSRGFAGAMEISGNGRWTVSEGENVREASRENMRLEKEKNKSIVVV